MAAVILADTRRLEDSFTAIDFFERRGVPFAVAVNRFEGALDYACDEVREALDLDHKVPVVLCDARDRDSAFHVLITAAEHALASARSLPAPVRTSQGAHA